MRQPPVLRGSGPRAVGSKPPGRPGAGNVLLFRRRRGAIRRSRRSPLLRWLRPFLTALAIVGVPTALVAWPMTSELFALRQMAVETGERVSEDWVRRALGSLVGENLPLASLEHAEGLLLRHPWVQSADLRKQLPSSLTVRVTEKTAVAILRQGHELYYLDIHGSPITLFDPLAGSADLVLISRSQPRADLRSAVELAKELERVDPSWGAGLSEIEILGERDFRLFTTSLPFPLLVRAGTLAEKSRRLEELLPWVMTRYRVAAIDLRFARRIIVQTSAGAATGPAGTETRKATADHA